MWGSTETLDVLPLTSNPPVQFTFTPQLANIEHTRPEAWQFIITATLTQIIALNGNNPWSVFVKCGWGLGRASVLVDPFVTFTWADDTETQVMLGKPKIVQRVVVAKAAATDTHDNILDRIAAQTLQAQAYATKLLSQGQFKVAMSAFFAPTALGGGLPVSAGGPTMPTPLNPQLQKQLLDRRR
jgi:hypothetical protein